MRLIARNNEVMATRRTDAAGHVAVRARAWRAGRAGCRRRCSSPPIRAAITPSSVSRSPAFDFSDRGVAGRAVPAGLDAFVYTERGVYRTGETVHVTALLRDARGVAALDVPLTLVVERPDGVEYRRAVVADQGLGGRNLDVPIAPTASTGTWRVRAFTDPKRPAVGEASFMVEDYVPDRMEFDLASKATAVAKGKPFEVTVDGRFLYGAPASDLEIGGDVKVQAAAGRPGFAGYQFGSRRRRRREGRHRAAARGSAAAPMPPARPSSTSPLDKLPETTRPLEAQITVHMAEAGGRAIERKLTLPVTPAPP